MIRREVETTEQTQKELDSIQKQEWAKNNAVHLEIFRTVCDFERLACVNEGIEETKTILKRYYKEVFLFYGKQNIDHNIALHLSENVVYPWRLVNMTDSEIVQIENIDAVDLVRIRNVLTS